MQVWNVLHAARCKYRTQKVAKNRHLGTIAQLCRAISSQLRHVSTIGKKLVKQQYLLYMSHNMVNFGQLAAEILSLVWGTPANFNGFSRLGSVTARHLVDWRQTNFAALNRGRHLCSAGRPSRWALAHILVFFVTWLNLDVLDIAGLWFAWATERLWSLNHALNPFGPSVLRYVTREHMLPGTGCCFVYNCRVLWFMDISCWNDVIGSWLKVVSAFVNIRGSSNRNLLHALCALMFEIVI